MKKCGSKKPSGGAKGYNTTREMKAKSGGVKNYNTARETKTTARRK